MNEIISPNLRNFWQFIVPLTDMNPETATVYFAEGFNQYWKDATYKSMKIGHWSRTGFRSCFPMNQFLEEDATNLILNKMRGAVANIGDLIIFDTTLPHAPNWNHTNNTRLVIYPYLAPLIISKDGIETSFLPNSIDSVKQGVLIGKCPIYSAHPWTNYKLSTCSQNFFSSLSYQELPRSLLGDCLFGFKNWEEFENSTYIKYIFNSSKSNRDASIAEMEQPIINALCNWNNTTEKLLQLHSTHSNYERGCQLCERIENATLSEWWHSTEAIYHTILKCSCIKCIAVKNEGWKLWNSPGGCTCNRCKK